MQQEEDRGRYPGPKKRQCFVRTRGAAFVLGEAYDGEKRHESDGELGGGEPKGREVGKCADLESEEQQEEEEGAVTMFSNSPVVAPLAPPPPPAAKRRTRTISK